MQTYEHVAQGFWKLHVNLVRAWKDSLTKNEVDKNYAKIHEWWKAFGAISIAFTRKLERWLAWWNARCKQWGIWMQKDMSFEKNVAMPTCNLVKAKHASWWNDSGNGKKVKTNLISTTFNDLVCAIFQHSRFQRFLKKEVVDKGPTIEKLNLRATQQLSNAKNVTNVINWIIVGTRMHGKGIGLKGDDY
jgi:hypothetical protein